MLEKEVNLKRNVEREALIMRTVYPINLASFHFAWTRNHFRLQYTNECQCLTKYNGT